VLTHRAGRGTRGSRRVSPPTDVLAALGLRRGERALAYATGTSGEWYVGSNLALYLPAEGGGHRRLGWEQVERADWQRDDDRLAVVEVADWGEPERGTVIHIDEPGQLLELLRERVTKSVVCSVYSPVRRSTGVTVVGRRSPSGQGPVTWSYVLSAGLDPHDPQVAAVMETTLERARSELDGL
jgi:hypothetical protein